MCRHYHGSGIHSHLGGNKEHTHPYGYNGPICYGADPTGNWKEIKMWTVGRIATLAALIIVVLVVFVVLLGAGVISCAAEAVEDASSAVNTTVAGESPGATSPVPTTVTQSGVTKEEMEQALQEAYKAGQQSAAQSNQQTPTTSTTIPVSNSGSTTGGPLPTGDQDPISSEQFESSQPNGAPMIYWLPTGVGNTKDYTNVDVPSGYVGIKAGYIVDGTEGGVLKTVSGPAKINATITDGFVGVFRKDFVQQWIDKHLEQAVIEGWAYAVIER